MAEINDEKLEEQEVKENAQEEPEQIDEVVEEVDELTLAKQQIEEEQDKLIRLRADFENYKRRVQLDKASDYKYRAQSVLMDILPVLDNFERALAVEPTTEEATSLVKGVDMVYRTLLEAVKKEGLEQIEAEGVAFDPNFHQAVMQEQDDSKESGIVLQELQKGYKLKDRVLRPSMVKVNE
ncbi:nucleotide exchange factor GrpE [Psychrobacillus sp. INOP01]|uniref:nucleotide exchange factor GrpE n=1 Tax=Psychrobacillus sp. INOP01 TaxID=2829187 RepID=UPI001BA592EB|nr:nucleotide exchange factor GrpE [Psychrobacillus sp. INOP01]QUG42158.1 nucleotide exchange factor GrpE [Psychrobacillus sp. INOP01]